MITFEELALMILHQSGYQDARIDQQGNSFFVYLDKDTQFGEFDSSAGFDPSMSDVVYFGTKELELAAKLATFLCAKTAQRIPEAS